MKIGDKVKCINRDRLYLTHGNVYPIIDFADSVVIIRDDDGDLGTYSKSNFELVSLSKTFEYALTLVGKTVIRNGKPMKVDSVRVMNKHFQINNRIAKEEIAKQGYCIMVENEFEIYPLSEVSEISDTVELNGEYKAIVDGEVVKVGCQVIPIEKVKEILAVYENLKA